MVYLQLRSLPTPRTHNITGHLLPLMISLSVQFYWPYCTCRALRLRVCAIARRLWLKERTHPLVRDLTQHVQGRHKFDLHQRQSHYTSGSDIFKVYILISVEPVAQAPRIWSTISSAVLPTNNPQHSMVTTVGMDNPSSTRTHWFRVGVPSKLREGGIVG